MYLSIFLAYQNSRTVGSYIIILFQEDYKLSNALNQPILLDFGKEFGSRFVYDAIKLALE